MLKINYNELIMKLLKCRLVWLISGRSIRDTIERSLISRQGKCDHSIAFLLRDIWNLGRLRELLMYASCNALLQFKIGNSSLISSHHHQFIKILVTLTTLFHSGFMSDSLIFTQQVSGMLSRTLSESPCFVLFRKECP